MENKPKEFWILKTPGGEFIEYDEPMNYDWKVCKKIHVIEKSAYDKLQAELDDWKAGSSVEAKEADRLREQLAEAKAQIAEQESLLHTMNALLEDKNFQIRDYEAALKEAAEWHRCDDVNGEAGRIAHETLKKWKSK